jgi:GNAT superfamily N-acetyltransferase
MVARRRSRRTGAAAGAPTPASGLQHNQTSAPTAEPTVAGRRSPHWLFRSGCRWYFTFMDPIEVRAARPEDSPFIRELMIEQFAGTDVAGHDELIDVTVLPALIAWSGARPIGLLTYRPDPVARAAQRAAAGWELVSIGAAVPGRGAGSALIEALRVAARSAGIQRIWLVTTNDNLHALRFYQRRGFDLVRVDRDAVTRARVLKPSIPTHADGIAIRHEIELEMVLGDPV